MANKIFLVLASAMLLVGMCFLAFDIQPVKAIGTIYIRADGSIDPSTAPIQRDGDIYTLTGNITSDADGIVIERNNMTLDGAGYTIQGTGSMTGIDLTSRSNVTIKNMEIKTFDPGIWLENSPNNDISANNITNNNYYGIYLSSSQYNNVSGNNITNNNNGLYLGSSSNNNSIIGNLFANDGLMVYGSHGNVVEDNLVNGKPLVYLEDVSGFKIENAGQVILVNCDGIRVENLDLSRASIGIELWNTINTKIIGNNITSNGVYGILLWSSSNNNSIIGNNITNNLFGICLASSNYDGISGNNITNSYQGVYLSSSQYNNVSGNNITNNNSGISLESSSNNKFHNNNFIENIQQVYFYNSGYANFWDGGYPSGGNYWSDYTGADLYSGSYQNETGSDGIGDSYYLIDANNRDNYPLMKSWVPYENGPIYIRADGSIDPSGAPVVRKGDAYTLTGNITSDAEGIVIERDNMTLDGAGYTVEGKYEYDTYGCGIKLWYRNNVTIKNMRIKDFYSGIQLEGSSNNKIVGNSVTNSSFSAPGIYVGYSSNNNTVEDNNVTANKWIGIALWQSSYNTISRNNIVANYQGLSFGLSSNNSIYHNNFISNTYQIYHIQPIEPENAWDNGYPSGGNHWSDYTGVDLFSGPYQNETGSDGIGDTPYVIDANNTDRFPLMPPEYYLAVRTDPSGIVTIPGEGWYVEGTAVTLTAPAYASVAPYIRYRFNYWDVDGAPHGIGVNPITLHSDANHTATAHYILQYQVTFAQTGLDSTAVGTVVTVNGNAKEFADMPFSVWVDNGSSLTYFYNDIVLSSVTGEKFKQVSVTGPASPITATGAVTVTGNFKTQYQVTFDQTGVGTDFTGTIVTIDSVNYNGLPVSFWWDQGSSHSFSFASPLAVNAIKKYVWSSTSGLSTLLSDTLTITASGSVVGNYIAQNAITFDQVGVSPDFTGTVVVVDGTPYGVVALPVSFYWQVGTVHNFAFQSPLTVTANAKRYAWTSTTGLSSVQSGSVTVTTYGSVVGNYKTQYFLTLATSPLGVDAPAGAGWYDYGTYASISTAQYDDIVPGSSRYRFDGWSASDMSEIADPTVTSTTVLMDKPKTVTANYVIQYYITFDQTGVGSDFTGTVVTIDSANYGASALPVQFWWNDGSSHTYSFASPLAVNASKQYVWSSTSGLSTLQSDPLTITASGSVTGNYIVQNAITFDQVGVDSDFTGTVVIIDGVSCTRSQLPISFAWNLNSLHSFAFQSPLAVGANAKQHVWISTTGLSDQQGGSVTVTTFGSIVGNYKTQYCLNLATSPSGVNTPSGAGWYDSGTYATISTAELVDITPGSSRFRFDGWTTTDMAEVTNPSAPSTTVLMDKAKTVAADYVIQHKVTFNQSGVGSDFTGTALTVDATGYTRGMLPYDLWWDSGSFHTFAYNSPLVATANAKQYVWTSTTGLSMLQGGYITVSGSGSVTGNYKTQYYFTVNSLHDSPTPTSGWFDAQTPITASVASPWSGPIGTRYVCTGWTGIGSVPASGTSSTVTFTIDQPSGITWNWKTQYLLTVLTNPSGLSPQPTRNPAGEAGPANGWWYDTSAGVALTAQSVTGYNFNHWDTDGASHGSGVNPIIANMNAPHTVTAHYTALVPILSVSINPLSRTISVGQSVPFSSTVTGGTPPYSYQWYLNGNPVTGANSSSWSFTPTTTGTYYAHLKVTDASNNSAQSETANIMVSEGPPTPPVGGEWVPIDKLQLLPLWTSLASTIAVAASLVGIKRIKKRQD